MTTDKSSVGKYKELARGKVIQRTRMPVSANAGNKAHLGHVYRDENIRQFHVSENPFPFVFVDLTYRCNMACNVCYNPVRPMPDMTLEYFEEGIRQLPNPVEIRMLGGEPTIHPQFFDFMNIASKYGHNIYVSTNGIRLANEPNFSDELQKFITTSPTKTKIHMDMSGGYDRDIYEVIHDDRDALDTKLAALDAMMSRKIGRVTVSAILIRNLNEHVIPDLFDIAENHSRSVREVAFRSQGKIGRYVGDEKPYTTNEWLRMMLENEYIKKNQLSDVIMAGFMSEKCKGKNCCYHYRDSKKLSVSWLDFLNDSCWLRGQMLENDHMIEYMFESIETNDFSNLDYSDKRII